MINRFAFVDDPLMSREFQSGDFVRKTGVRGTFMAPYTGRVIYADMDTGFVSVQWPWGVDLDLASELIKVNAATTEWFPSMYADQGYSTWERSRNINTPESLEDDAKWRKKLATSIVELYEQQTLPIWREACRSLHYEEDEIYAFQRLSAIFAEEFGTEAVRLTLSNLYEHARRLSIYWNDPKRKYRVTQKEKVSGKYACPRCKCELKPRVYRQGRRALQCSECGFSIDSRDLVKR